MNKLMIAATIALSMGSVAMAQQADCGNFNYYDLSMSLKTTAGKQVTLKWKDCFGKHEDNECYRVKGSAKMTGVIIADCCFEDGDVFLWTTKKVELNKIKFNGILYADDAVALMDTYRIGVPDKNLEAGDTEVNMAIGGAFVNFWAQGFGSWDKKNAVMKSADGSIVGLIPAPWCPCFDSIAFDCDMNEIAPAFTVAFGTWKAKLNTKKSGLNANKNATDSMPKNLLGFTAAD